MVLKKAIHGTSKHRAVKDVTSAIALHLRSSYPP
jgi:hypothetical protein